MTKIKMDDLRALGVCVDVRHWFIKHDLDWRAFVRDGLEADLLRGPGDSLHLIDKLEQAAKKREARDGQR